MPDTTTALETRTELQSELQLTLEAMQLLPEIDRAVLILRAEEGLSYEEIARTTGLTITAAKVKVFRARAKLVSLLSKTTPRNEHE
jgi:RNA polymerase sigma-70 factor (ECF subfamily)